MDYQVSTQLYVEVATRLQEAIDDENYFSGTLQFRFGEVECRLLTSVIVYRKPLRRPEGEFDAISDLIPVWWEFHTVGDQGELLNDFDFSQLLFYL